MDVIMAFGGFSKSYSTSAAHWFKNQKYYIIYWKADSFKVLVWILTTTQNSADKYNSVCETVEKHIQI